MKVYLVKTENGGMQEQMSMKCDCCSRNLVNSNPFNLVKCLGPTAICTQKCLFIHIYVLNLDRTCASIRDVPVLVKTKVPNQWLVDNSQLKSDADRIAYRVKKDEWIHIEKMCSHEKTCASIPLIHTHNL